MYDAVVCVALRVAGCVARWCRLCVSGAAGWFAVCVAGCVAVGAEQCATGCCSGAGSVRQSGGEDIFK